MIMICLVIYASLVSKIISVVLSQVIKEAAEQLPVLLECVDVSLATVNFSCIKRMNASFQSPLNFYPLLPLDEPFNVIYNFAFINEH